VAITLGMTVRQTEFPNLIPVERVFEAVRDLDIEVVATLAPDDIPLVAEVPDNVRVVPSVPLHALLPTCAAIVHHGGAGTWATAAVCGVPQVAMGWMWDAIYRAQRLEDLGAGLHLSSHEVSASALREKLTRVLSEPLFQAGADRLRAEMLAAPTPNDIVPRLEELAARR
jgi:glycosyltransferase